jgi:hypothetical protein
VYLEMRKYQIFVVAVFAVFAFFVVAAASAFAEAPVTLLAEWLVNGAAVEENLSVSAEGTLTLTDLNALKAGIVASALCTGVLMGTVGLSGVDEINELLTVGGVLVPLVALEGAGLVCENSGNCEEPLAWAVLLPWPTLLELFEQLVGTVLTSFFAILLRTGAAGKPGWYVECLDLGVTVNDECTANTEGVAQATNLAEGIDASFSEEFLLLVELPLALCSSSGTESGLVEGLGVIKTTAPGTTLQVSSIG